MRLRRINKQTQGPFSTTCATSLRKKLLLHPTATAHIEPGTPRENPFVESLHFAYARRVAQSQRVRLLLRGSEVISVLGRAGRPRTTSTDCISPLSGAHPHRLPSELKRPGQGVVDLLDVSELTERGSANVPLCVLVAVARATRSRRPGGPVSEPRSAWPAVLDRPPRQHWTCRRLDGCSHRAVECIRRHPIEWIALGECEPIGTNRPAQSFTAVEVLPF